MSKLQHIAFIMDGNSTWAKYNNKSNRDGYIAGINALINVALLCEQKGIKYATFYAFSTENWLRSKSWLDSFFGVAFDVLDNDELLQKVEHMRLVLLGDIKRLDLRLQKKLYDLVEKTKNNVSMTVCIAISYGGRDEIVRACKKINGDITEDAISQNLDTAGLPDPDLIIRTKSEKRMSNFLLWQSAYSELHFSDVLWPDFGKVDLDNAIADYNDRKRTYGRQVAIKD